MPSDDVKEKIRALCSDAGFPIVDIRDDGKMLILVPESPESIPEADVLRRLADQIRGYEYRHIAVSVEPDTT